MSVFLCDRIACINSAFLLFSKGTTRFQIYFQVIVLFYRKIIKPVFDVVLSFFAIIVLALPMLIISLAIIIDDPGPVIFKQRRIGKNKKEFHVLKFRTMKMSAPHDTPTHLLGDPMKYITRVGLFLRKTSLDELPQIYNIFLGQMSIIGPRPALYNQYDLIAERDKYGANALTPGLTGLAQISGRDELEIPVKARVDGQYAENISLITDLRIFFLTIVKTFKHDGVVEGGTGTYNIEQNKDVESGAVK